MWFCQCAERFARRLRVVSSIEKSYSIHVLNLICGGTVEPDCAFKGIAFAAVLVRIGI